MILRHPLELKPLPGWRGLGSLGDDCPCLNPPECSLCLDPVFPDDPIGCSSYRACDKYTGAVHFEYALPYGTVNDNIWMVSGDQLYWKGSSPPPPTPVLPDYVKDSLTFSNAITENPSTYSVPLVTGPNPGTPIVNQAPAPTNVVQKTTTTQQPAVQQPAAPPAPVQQPTPPPPVQQPGAVTQTQPTSSVGTPDVAQALNRVWKSITAGSAAGEPGKDSAAAAAASPLSSIPVWAWGLAGAAAAYFIFGRNKR